MYRYLSENDIANTVRMMRTNFGGSIILVEGHSDMRVYRRFFDHNKCRLVLSFGKENALKALLILENDSLKGILAIVDSDFFRIESNKPEDDDLFLTDYHDLESMIISSNVLEDILLEFGNSNDIKNYKFNIQDILYESASYLGFFRWISSKSKENLRLKFKGINFLNFIDKNTLMLDIKKLMKEVINNSNQIVNKKNIELKILYLKKSNYDLKEVCSGHDLIEILYIGLKYIFGNRKTISLDLDVFDSAIKLSYNYSYFSQSNLFAELEKWEQNNINYKIFSNPKIVKN